MGREIIFFLIETFHGLSLFLIHQILCPFFVTWNMTPFIWQKISPDTHGATYDLIYIRCIISLR